MLRFKINAAKSQFFDKAVTAGVDKATVRVLSRFGAYVRTSARGLIRSGKKPSKPGKPPRNVLGLLKQFIFFVFDPTRKSVVIGPARLNGRNLGNAPETLEHGGNTTIRKLKVRRGQPAEWEQKTVRIEARPFMGPAYTKEESKLMPLWRDSIK